MTGEQTEIGKIARSLEQSQPEETPLQKELDHVGKLLGLAVIAIVVIVGITILLVDHVTSLADLITNARSSQCSPGHPHLSLVLPAQRRSSDPYEHCSARVSPLITTGGMVETAVVMARTASVLVARDDRGAGVVLVPFPQKECSYRFLLDYDVYLPLRTEA
jgi:hypothetical protein